MRRHLFLLSAIHQVIDLKNNAVAQREGFMTTKDLIEISSCVGRKGNDSSDVPFDPWTR
jgi:hypothetical protein